MGASVSRPRITVAIIDDQPLVRAGLRTLLTAEDDLELIGEAGDGASGLRLVRTYRPDVVLCDIRMPGTDGLALLAAVTSEESLADVRVVMLTTFELDEYVFEALRSGASGFLLKDAEPTALLDAIRVVAGWFATCAVGDPPGHRALRDCAASDRAASAAR